MNELWKRFSGDFNAMTDKQIEEEVIDCLERIDNDEEWLDAVASWKAAGKPRDEKQTEE